MSIFYLPHANKIAWKIIASLVVFSTLITIVTTGVQLYTEYGRDIDAIDTRFDQVERSYIKSVSENVWEADVGRLNLLVSGIIEFPNFIYAEVRDENGLVLASEGEINDENLITKNYPLVQEFRGKNQEIGVLEITVGLSEVYGRIFDRVWLILVSNGIKTFLVAIFMYLLVYWLLTRHLDVIATASREIDFTKKPVPVTVNRGPFLNQPDEIDQLVDAFNDMQETIYDSYIELRALNIDLEMRVNERTQELSDKVIEQKRTAAELARNEERLRDIAEAGSDWMWEMDSDLRFSYISESSENHGTPKANDLIGRHRKEMSAEDDDELWAQHMSDMENRRSFRDFRYLMKRGDDEAIHVRISGKPIFDDDGEFKGYRGIGTNITEQVEAEAFIAETSQKLHVLSSAIQQNPSMVFITDKSGNIEYVNETFSRMTQYKLSEVIGKNPRILKSQETPPETHADIWDRILNGKSWRGEIRDIRKDGEGFWAYATIAPIKNEMGETTHFVATHEDISIRKDAERKLLDATKQAEFANRAKTELLANMSHELRTPLNAIIGFSQAFLGQLFGKLGNDKYLEYAGDINASGNHLLELINDILDVSAIEAGKVNLHEIEVPIGRILKSSLRLVEPRANSEGIILNMEVAPDLPEILVDERRIKQVFLNLLSNAVKFTEKGGSVTISATHADNGGVDITVSDTGIGMTDDEIITAMSAFGQVDGGLNRKEEGTGLGLPLTESLVELHDGTLDLKSEKGVGTTVTVNIPQSRLINVA
ncbi:MAG: PAS domain S-box protein [Rhodospirillaceae bacterium]|jgi:PAS domain S-box-containing protein|nr:PAS domain S-box protein [Rhodospirillaceae bacterium]MBT4220345.1 PAS domain S-box protein [Rhodospirillaceae bacterium]MBT4463694.1 PAS domain S-box protein [Rhodospirillaceae bacterium]MBT5013869.1 PAS domain S-box protein [Rhodospirillaceae bacterium]MBT5308726.1 PAS domain S-box protein [Rhodospirillaceae bacterium]